ncbi:hypothetical protein ACPPVU_08945 [Mucilaginibacter sp. McL0603]|uniref:hypothetical protein n=1 Tax=Mucilaginibacter sp. McL0603 TaxID=3415670 RepID=UPI003CE9C171
MSNLTKSHIEPPTSDIRHLTSEEIPPWAILSQSPVRKVPKRDVFNMVLIGVAKAFADLNNKSLSPQERDYMVNELTDNIIARYPAIRINEIPVAIANGIRGKYGEFYGLSVVAFERFIEQYLLSEERVQAVKSLPALGTARPAPGKQEQFATAKSNTLMALQHKQSGKSFASMAGSVYDFLDRLQLLQFNRDEKYDMMADACRQLVGDLKYKLLTAPGHQRSALRRDKDAYTAALKGGALTGEQNQNVIRISKRLALDAFFNQVMMEEVDLDAVVEGKRGCFEEVERWT